MSILLRGMRKGTFFIRLLAVLQYTVFYNQVDGILSEVLSFEEQNVLVPIFVLDVVLH